MTYYESAEQITITQARALKELVKHGHTNPSEFFEECGMKDSYNAQDVLNWLGY